MRKPSDGERRGFVPLIDLVERPGQKALVLMLGILACIGWTAVVDRLMG